MKYIADLHIHSRYSRATSPNLNLAHLAAWAGVKGIDLLATGDFTHPAWRKELGENLRQDEQSGFYRFAGRPEPLDFLEGNARLHSDRPGPLFCLEAEISSIYRRHGAVRKVHNLVFMPDLEAVERFCQRLERIGNLHSDGRPILGLDSRDLLEIALESDPRAVLIPAHVWTPWFALFGSKSGFDRLEDCFGDLSGEIFALETGLSSDPGMNRCLSALDGYALISNSDAHSGANLGREANLFCGQLSYDGLFSALRAAARREAPGEAACRFLGTLEFYAEEGKYHLDGHRACGVCLNPRETRELKGICPVCGRPLTIGVLHRVMELADRESPPDLPNEPGLFPLVPLPEIVGEILAAKPGSKRVGAALSALVRDLGPELHILWQSELDELNGYWPALGEAVARVRAGNVRREAGYDGQYGRITVFEDAERRELAGLASLPGLACAKQGRAKAGCGKIGPALESSAVSGPCAKPVPRKLALFEKAERKVNPGPGPALSQEQEACALAGLYPKRPGPVLVAAGPGAGKTRVLVERLCRLLDQGLAPDAILALSFTRRAANEVRERLQGARPGASSLPLCTTLHGLAHALLAREFGQGACPLLLDENNARALFFSANSDFSSRELARCFNKYELAREQLHDLTGRASVAAERYAALKLARGALDFGDLLAWLRLKAPEMRGRWQQILVDEAQDLSPLQIEILAQLLPADGAGFFGIGDPDQAIYGFRGARGISGLEQAWPGLRRLELGQSHRASQPVLDLAQSLLEGQGACGPLSATSAEGACLEFFQARDEREEAQWVARRARQLLGSGAHSLLDSAGERAQSKSRSGHSQLAGKSAALNLDASLSLGDIAVLVRLKAQIPPLVKALEEQGLACEAPGEDAFWEDGLCRPLLCALAGFFGLPWALAESGQDDPGYAPALERLQAQGLALEALAPGKLVQRLGQLFAADFGPDASLAEHLKLLRTSRAFALLCAQWEALQAEKPTSGWPGFFERLAWLGEAEILQARAEKIRILTIHASKGLEFQAVFLPGLEQGLLPLEREKLYGAGLIEATGADALAEERRLLYVGLTRAARGIFVSLAKKRHFLGRSLELAPSPFLEKIRAFCRKRELRAPKPKPLSLFSLGGERD